MQTEEYIFPSAKFTVHEKYIIAEPKQQIDISTKELQHLHEIVEKHIEGPFGLIEIRQANISINPVVYYTAKELMPNFVAYALVSIEPLTARTFPVEEDFMKEKEIQYKLCSTLDEAKQWMDNTI